MLPSLNISLKSEVRNILQVLKRRKEIEGIKEGSYLSNFEVISAAFKVRASPKILPRSAELNREESRLELLSVIECAFQKVDTYGLRVELL